MKQEALRVRLPCLPWTRNWKRNERNDTQSTIGNFMGGKVKRAVRKQWFDSVTPSSIAPSNEVGDRCSHLPLNRGTTDDVG